MSYADKAAKKGSLGETIDADKQEIDPQIQETKEKITTKLDNFKDKSKKKLDSIDREDIEQKLDNAENAIVRFVKYVGNAVGYYSNVAAEKVGSAGYTAKEEFKNPVVATQALITTGLLAGGVYAYQERFRIKRIPDDVLYVYAAVLTGFVVLDGFTFKKLYPKYK